MRIPRLPSRRWTTVAAAMTAAFVLATAAILATDVGNTQATEPSIPQVAENSPAGTAVGAPLSATTTAGTVSYSLTGTDAASFAINPTNGEIRLAADVSPDFEAKSTYELNVVASTTVAIEVTNVNEPGIVNLSPQAPGVGDTVTATLIDPDGGVANMTWSWSRSDADTWNTMAGATQASYTTGADDIGHRIRAEVSYDDAAGTSQQANAATDAVKNDPPAFANASHTRTVAEDAADGSNLGDPITATDPNRHTITYSLTGSNAFDVNRNNGQVAVVGGVLNYEEKDSHTLTLTATDSHDATGTTAITVTVTNADEAGTVTLSHGSLRKGAVVSARLSDPDGDVSDITWKRQRDGTDITSANGASYTATNDDVGHRLTAIASYTDGHGSAKSAQGATASQVGNDAPTFSEASPTRSIDENAAVGTPVGAAIAAIDANLDSLQYSVSSTNFSIDANGAIVSAAVLDYEEANRHSVVVTATDEHNAAGTVTVTISVNNLDETGAITLDKTSPKVGDTVSASLTDPDGTTSAGHGNGRTATAPPGRTSRTPLPRATPSRARTWAGA